MHHANLRTAMGSTLVMVLTFAIVLGTNRVTVGQVVKPALPIAPEDGKKIKSQAIEVMTFPSDRDAKNMIRAVNDYLTEFKDKSSRAPWDKICAAAQQVLDAKSDSFFEKSGSAGDDAGKIQRVSAKAEANRLIGRFPPDGKQFYQLTFGPPAEALIADAKDKGYDRAILADVSQRYFHTKAGTQATLYLAGLNLDRGNYVESAYSFERLLERKDIDDLWNPLTTFKAIMAFKRAGSQSATVAKLTAQLEKNYPRNGLKIGLRTYTIDELKEELAKPHLTMFGRISENYIISRLGNASHSAIADGGAPFLDPSYTKPMLYRTQDAPFQEGSTWVRQNLNEVLRGIRPAKQEVAIPGFFPLTSQNLVFIRTYDGIYAYITQDGFSNHGRPAKSGDLFWIAEAKGSLSKIVGDDSKTDVINRWTAFQNQGQLKSILFENPLVGSMSHDGQNVYAIDDAAIPNAPVINNQDGGFGGQGVPVTSDKLFGDGNRLIALNMVTGRLAWQLGVSQGGPPLSDEEDDKTDNPLLLMQNSYFLGPPLPVNGKIYVLFEKNGKVRLACLDPNKVRRFDVPGGKPSDKGPELVWSQRIGEPNVKLPVDTYRRFQCAYLTYSDGVLICPTNAGAVVAIDIMARSLMWARSYRSIKGTDIAEEQGPGGGAMRRVRVLGGVNPSGAQTVLSSERWRSAAPIITNGRVIFTAFDSESMDCLDLRTGDLLWTEPRRSGDLYAGGVLADKVVVVGKESLRAINVIGQTRAKATATGKEDAVIAWRDLRIGTPAGHGTASKGGVFYVPLADSPDGSRPEVWAIDVAKGEVIAKAAFRVKDDGGPKPMLGNLAFHEGQLFSQSPNELAVFPLIELKKREMDRLLKANPKDPSGLVARAELNMDEGKLADAVADFKEADKNSPNETTRQRLRDKLYVAYTELMRKDFASAEGFLAEYKTLCDISTEAEEPNAKQRLIDEKLRRQGLYLQLLAKGRESQGRLAEAFDYYRGFASLGSNKQLISIYDEPNGQTRPDVWAQGRIEMMIRNAKDPAVRKPLEDRVAKDWEAIRAKGDLTAIREFVQVFGYHFASGKEAQLALAQKLIESNTEEATREAQNVLLKLWSITADDRTTAARAIEMLAALSTRRGMMDDSVAYYSRLGTEYADVVVREGKTGADYFGDLLTDKRLLPYLEPTRTITPSRIKADRKVGNPGGAINMGFALNPEGAESNPFFKRHRLMMDNNTSGNGTYTLRVEDRATNEVKSRYPNFQLYAPNGPPQHQLAQLKGHILLLHAGMKVHCLDLAEKRQLWEVSVLGEGTKVDFNNVSLTPGVDGEVFVTYNADGFRISLGRSTILESNYVCVVTRDGLSAYEPTTGNKLWTRNNVSSASLVFGDGKHVFLVETLTDGKSRSRVLRAVDGMTVDGVPDFGTLVTGPARQRIIGRNILLSEGGNGKPRTLRLYDPLAANDIWKKEYPADATLLKSYVPDSVAMLKVDGRFDVLANATGKVQFEGRIDEANLAAHMKGLHVPILVADGERYYVVLNRTANANRQVNWGNNQQIKTVPLSGAMYCFDKATSKRLWFTETLTETQQLMIERFDELPAIVIAGLVQSEENNGQPTYKFAIIDKQNGRLRLMRNENQGNTFYSMQTDPKNATARLVRGDFYVDIGPDLEAKPPTTNK